jgi:hypothetical protein
VTAAIQQDGANRVNVIRSAADREASTEFAKAAAMRPNIVGAALGAVSRDRGLCDALFDVLEAQNLLKNPQLRVTVIPAGGALLAQLEADRNLKTR